MSRCIAGLLALVLAIAGTARAEQPFRHLGPVEVIDNGVVRLEVAPRVGRIVSYHRKGEPNRLVVVDKAPNPGWNWNPWGGDRVWPTAQMLNAQIYGNNGFDPVIDGAPWELVSKTADTLVMRSGISPQLGIRITRDISLGKGSSEAVHRFTVECLRSGRFPVHVWTVTGVRKGDAFFMESDPRTRHPGWKPFKWWMEVSPALPQAELLKDMRVLKVPLAQGDFKVGTYGRWVALVEGNSAFVQSTEYRHGEMYLETSSLQVFRKEEIATHELETLSPSWLLQKGEKREWVTVWNLVDFPKEAASDRERALWLQSFVERRLGNY